MAKKWTKEARAAFGRKMKRLRAAKSGKSTKSTKIRRKKQRHVLPVRFEPIIINGRSSPMAKSRRKKRHVSHVARYYGRRRRKMGASFTVPSAGRYQELMENGIALIVGALGGSAVAEMLPISPESLKPWIPLAGGILLSTMAKGNKIARFAGYGMLTSGGVSLTKTLINVNPSTGKPLLLAGGQRMVPSANQRMQLAAPSRLNAPSILRGFKTSAHM